MSGLPFVGSLYDYSRGPGANISQLLLEQGRARAASADRIGQIWQDTISNLGNVAGQEIQRKRDEKRNEALSSVMNAYLSSPDATPEQAYGATLKVMGNPKDALTVAQGLVAFKKASHPDTPPEIALGELPSIYDAYKAAPDALKPGIWHNIKQGLGSKMDMSQLPDQPSPEAEKFVSQYVDTLRKKERGPQDLFAEEKAKAEGKAAGTPVEPPKPEKTLDQMQAEEFAKARGRHLGDPTGGAPKQEKLVKHSYFDEETGQNVEEFVPESELKGKKFRSKLGATVENRADSAKSVYKTGNDIIAATKDPKIAAMLGPVLGRYNTLQEFIGNPPPEFANLAANIESFSLANMGVHGMRSAQGAEMIRKMLGQKLTPEALSAATDGLMNFSRHYMETVGVKVPESAPKENDPLGIR